VDDVHISEEAVFEMLNSPTGLVAPLMLDLADRAAAVAIAVVHVRPGTPASARTGRGSNARPPGFTKELTHPYVGWDDTGHIYGSAAAPTNPTVFLEHPAIQMHGPGGPGSEANSYPFLTTGLFDLEGTV